VVDDNNNNNIMQPISIEETWKTSYWPIFAFILGVTGVNTQRVLEKIIYWINVRNGADGRRADTSDRKPVKNTFLPILLEKESSVSLLRVGY
jgi:hypothetical protein